MRIVEVRLRRVNLPSAQSGFTFNELLAAMAIVVVAVTGYSLSSISLFRGQTVSNNSTAAIHLAQDKLEELLARRPVTETDVCPNGGDRGISATGRMAPGLFDRCWRIASSPLGADLKRIDVTVSWRDLQDHRLTLSTLLYAGR